MEATPPLPLFPILCASRRPRLPAPSSLLAPHRPERPFFLFTRDGHACGDGDTDGGGGGGGGAGKEALIKVCGWGGSGDVDEARDLISRGIDIDEQNKNGS